MSVQGSDTFERWVAGREPEAFRVIVLEHAGMVYGTCRRLLGDAGDAEDVAQECFEVLASTERAPKIRSVGAWLHGVATKRSLQHIRADGRRREREDLFATRRDAHANIEWDDVYEYVDEAIAELPEDLRAPVVQHFLQAESMASIARGSGVSPRVVAYRIDKGLNQLRKALKRRGLPIAGAALASMMSVHAVEAAPDSLVAALGKLAIAQTVPAAATAGVGPAAGGAVKTWAVVAVVGLIATAAGAYYVFSKQTPPSSERNSIRPAASVLSVPPLNSNLTLADVTELDLDVAPAVTLAADSDAPAPAPLAEEELGGTVAVETAFSGISGHVLDPDGNPIDPIGVTLVDEGDLEGWRKAGTADGYYAFDELLPERSYVLLAFHDDHGTVMSDHLIMPAEGGLTNVDLQFGQGHSVYGRVVDTAGRGLKDASVRLATGFSVGSRSRSVSYGLSAQTDAEGSFILSHIGPATFFVHVSLEGYRMANRSFFKFTMPSNADHRDLRIVLTRTLEGFVAGRVSDPSGTPMAGIRLTAFSMEVGVRGTATTSADGAYIIENLGGADTVQVSTQTEGYVLNWRSVPVNSEHVDFVLVAHGTVRGRVLDRVTGSLIEEFEVRVDMNYSAEREVFVDARRPWKTFSSVDGEFLLKRVDPPMVRIAARAKGYSQALSDPIEVASRQTAQGVELRLSPGGTIGGRVTDSKGRALQGVDVHTFDVVWQERGGARTRTDEEGRFRLESMSPGSEVNVAAVLEGYAVGIARNIAAGAGQSGEVAFELRMEGRLTGSVHDGVEPVPNLMVLASREDRTPPGIFTATAMTDDVGRFSFAGLPAGNYGVYARRDAPVPAKWGAKAIVEEGETTEVIFEQPDDTAGAATVLVSVTAPDSPRNYTVLIAPEDRAFMSSAGLSAEGSFEFTLLPPGKYVVWVTPFDDDSLILVEKTLELAADAYVEVDLEL